MTEPKEAQTPNAPRDKDGGDADHKSTSSGAGREAVVNAPADHPHEHQSNYGGGGEHGGSKGR